MDIQELQSFRLSDAVKFNDRLNPRLWGSNEHLLPEVREKLMAIADDFREFLGISDLEIKDITISGSNAAYTYTPHSDIDLHLVVDLPKADISDVYRELFDAKKYQYNDQHDYKIGNYDVELYVQDSRKPHHSQGIYSLMNNDWVRVPSRRTPKVDDISVKSKFEDIGRRIEQAIASGNKQKMDAIADKVKTMRQAGLDTTGEFGPENLAFKALRTQGLLDQLRQARTAAKDAELSLAERKKSLKKKTRHWGKFGGMWFPGFGMYGSSATDSSDSGGDGGGESVTEQTTAKKDIKEILQPFIKSCIKYLGIQKPPKIILKRDPEWTRRNGTFGRFDPDTESVTLVVSGRHVLDILRTLAHELTHARQNELATMPVDAGKTGSPYEDDANATAGRIMRHWADNHPEYFKDVQLEDYDPNHPPGPESKPTMPAGTVRVDVSDVYDWYKLGQHISNLKGLGHHDFGKGPPSTIVSFGSEPEEHKYIKDLEKTGLTTTDIDPIDKNQPPGMKRQKVDPTYNVNEAFNQPYKLKWYPGDMDEVEAQAELNDGDDLTIMFNLDANEDGEEAWSVEFYRNNSQKVTGEGDAQRIFATVLSAIQTFIKKYKPNRIVFSASKEVEPGQKAQSRANLYDRLVQRYARALGYKAFRADAGNKVHYELSRIKQGVAEGTMKDLDIDLQDQQWDSVVGYVINGLKTGTDTDRMELALYKWAGRELYDVDQALEDHGFRDIADLADHIQQHHGRYRPPTDFGLSNISKGLTEASGYIPVNSREARDPRYSMAITQDIKPGETQRQARKMGFRTTAAGVPPILKASGKL